LTQTCAALSRAARPIRRPLAAHVGIPLLVEASGGRFIAILQPVSSVGKPRREYLPPQPEWDLRYHRAYGRIRSRIKAEGEGWAYDFSTAFDGDEAPYIDSFHVSARGNAIIAERMAETLGH